jgi:hypothetical protein
MPFGWQNVISAVVMDVTGIFAPDQVPTVRNRGLK